MSFSSTRPENTGFGPIPFFKDLESMRTAFTSRYRNRRSSSRVARASRSPLSWTLVALALLALSPARVAAQWYTESVPVGEDGAQVNTATVANESGHRFRVYRSGQSLIRGQFTIPEGFERLSSQTCPTWRVDKRFLVSTAAATPCQVGNWHADFVIAEIDGNQVRSAELDRVMRGTRLVFRYRIEGAGYRETTFSLRGSRRRIQAILGERIRVVTRR